MKTMLRRKTTDGFWVIGLLSMVILLLIPGGASALQGDLNGDGKADVVWRNTTTGAVSMWLMDGTTVASTGFPAGASLEWSIKGIGDTNGDGKADLVWRNTTTGAVAVWLMNGTTVALTGVLAGPSLEWSIRGVGDTNGDGKADLVWRNTTTGAVAVWLLNGTMVASTGFPAGAPLGWSIKGVGDTNGDGKADVVWRNTTTGAVAVWLMNGTLVISTGTLANAPLEWSIKGVGDTNGDGKADVVWRNTGTGAVAVWLMNGTTRTSTGFPAGAPLGWQIAGVGDVDADGKVDIIWRNNASGTVAVWLMNGPATTSTGFPGSTPPEWEIQGGSESNNFQSNPPLINKLVQEVDIHVPAVGIPLQLVRTYLLDSTFDGPMGYGWNHSYRMRIVEALENTRKTSTVPPPAGSVQVFNADGTGSVFLSNGDGTFQSPKGDFRTLTKASNGVYTLRQKLGTKFFFSGNGKLFRITDRNGNATTLQYDQTDRLESVTSASGQTVTFTYYSFGKIQAITDPAGRSVGYSYDEEGNLVSVRDFAGQITRYDYDSIHNLTTITDPMGYQTFFTINEDDRLETIANIGGVNQVSFAYGTPAPNQMKITNAFGQQTVFTYDQNSLITNAVDALGHTTSFTYDKNRNLSSVTDVKGERSEVTFDDLGNLVAFTDIKNNKTTLAYESVFNRVARMTDAKGQTTNFLYDNQGNLKEIISPDGSSDSFLYDSLGNMTSKTDRKNQTIRFTYNAQGLISKKIFPDGSADEFVYDKVGNLLSATDENGTISFSYDGVDRVTKVMVPGNVEVSYLYDLAGNRTGMIYPDGTRFTYKYDLYKRLTGLEANGSKVASYSYDILSRVRTRELGNQISANYDYNDSNQVTGIINRKSTNEIISSFFYTYDSYGNRISSKDSSGEIQYIYDQISQLIYVTMPDGSTVDYNLDSVGNRVSVNNAGAIENYSVNEMNQYLKVAGTTFEYDKNGNLIKKSTNGGVVTYTYDFENRLIQVSGPLGNTRFTYDPFGRRTSKTNASGTVNYFYDGFRVLIEKDKIGQILKSFMYGVGIDEILKMSKNGQDFYFNQDGLGSVTDITNSAEDIVESYLYDPYGNIKHIGSSDNPYYFTGRRFDSETGLYYLRARYYDPKIGRFINEDPIGLGGGIHLYTYSLNNPINFSDPLGLKFQRPPIRPPTNYPPLRRGNPRNQPESPTYPYNRNKERFLDDFSNFLDEYNSQIRPPSLDPWDWGDCMTTLRNCPNPGPTGPTGPVSLPPGWPNIPEWWPYFPNNPDDFPPCQDDLAMCKEPPPIDCGANSEKCTCQESNPDMCAADPTFVQLSYRGKAQQGKFSVVNQTLNWKEGKSDELLASIEIPYPDSLVRADVPVFGLAYGKNFKSYRVEVGEGFNPQDWSILNESTAPQMKSVAGYDLDDSLNLTIHGNLATWDTGLKNYVYLPSHPKDHPTDLKGTYTLRLVVTGEDGSTVEDRVTVDVANVIPNAWGGRVISPDEKVVLTVPEQALRDSFRLILIHSVATSTLSLPEGRTLLGSVYEARESGERFTKSVELRMAYTSAGIGQTDPEQVGIFGYDEKMGEWEYLTSYRKDEDDQAIFTDIQHLHSHYALMASLLPSEGSSIRLPAEPDSPVHQVSLGTSRGHYLVRNTFEDGLDEWVNRDSDVGGEVLLDDQATFDGTNALKISNVNAGGNFAVTVRTTSFDARAYPLVQFDYRIPSDVKTNFLVKVNGRWYEIGFTDDPKELDAQRVNIAHIGDIAGVIADDAWHTATFNLYDMLRTKTRHSQVEELIMADWDVVGYMKLQFGHNPKGASYYVDNFTISQDVSPGLRMEGDTILMDDFNQKKSTNTFNALTSVFSDESRGAMESGFSAEDAYGKGNALRLVYDVSDEGSYGGYLSPLPHLDLWDYDRLTFYVKGDGEEQDLFVGLRDTRGRESKVLVSNYLAQSLSSAWQEVSIPLVAFSDIVDWGRIDLLSLSVAHPIHKQGIVLVDQIEFKKRIKHFLVDNFERDEDKNSVDRPYWTFVNGNAAINGKRAHNSPNGIYRLSFGGNIGKIKAYASDVKSFAGWTTSIGGVDCSRCELLSFEVRGAEGEENATIYLDDGNFRWGLELAKFVDVTTDWQKVTIPIDSYAEAGVDMTHLDKIHVVFEGGEMSGTIYLDDIQLGEAVH
ncbi:MAG: RHS repeat-associated core domain-containing protein [Nitrospirales bacterium]|nr:FG-GAP-like repeat-containing protein [Nitrospirales bacterium]